jgi:hypothetical protein
MLKKEERRSIFESNSYQCFAHFIEYAMQVDSIVSIKPVHSVKHKIYNNLCYLIHFLMLSLVNKYPMHKESSPLMIRIIEIS